MPLLPSIVCAKRKPGWIERPAGIIFTPICSAPPIGRVSTVFSFDCWSSCSVCANAVQARSITTINAVIFVSRMTNSLRNNNGVARLQQDVGLGLLALDQQLVVHGNLCLHTVLGAQDV